MRKQLRQICKVLVNGQPCGLSYRYPGDFEEHQRLAHKPVEDNSKRPTFSNKDADDLPEEEQCHYCKQMFPAPVNLHHSEEECLANQQQA